jgi:hypothetical protein
MMRRICALQLCVLLFLTIGTFGQPYKDSIRRQFQDYTDLIKKKDFQGSLRFINPEFLKIIPAKQLVAAMEQVMNNPEIEVKVDEMKILSIGDTMIINGTQYVQLQYVMNMAMRMEESDTAAIKEGLAATFGKENVNYDAVTRFYQVTMHKNVVADSKDGHRWTFVVAEDRHRHILERFIPAKMLDFSE